MNSKTIIIWKYLLLPSMCLGISHSFFYFKLSKVPAEVTDTTRLIDTSSKKDISDITVALAEDLLTERIWFGFDEEVAFAIKHEITPGKAPSIVTVISSEEIKNSGYRTFVKILRTVPGFEILKEATQRVWSVYPLDTWDITNTLNYTLGAQHDHPRVKCDPRKHEYFGTQPE